MGFCWVGLVGFGLGRGVWLGGLWLVGRKRKEERKRGGGRVGEGERGRFRILISSTVSLHN